MTRTTMAMTLGLGLMLTGCGPTASEPEDSAAEIKPTATKNGPAMGGPAVDGSNPGTGKMGGRPPGGKAKGGGGGGTVGPPADIKSRMESDEYRNIAGSQGPDTKPAAAPNDKADPKKADPKKDEPK